MIKGGKIFLRALEPSDVDALYQWENDPSVWKVSNTLTPWSRHILEEYILSSHHDIYTNKQLRLVICDQEKGTKLGCIDLFDFDPAHRRAGVGILISPQERGKGVAKDALQTLIGYAFKTLDLHQLYAGVSVDNTASLKLFEGAGFITSGVRKEWYRTESGFADEVILQLLRDE